MLVEPFAQPRGVPGVHCVLLLEASRSHSPREAMLCGCRAPSIWSLGQGRGSVPRGAEARPVLSKHWDCRPVATLQYLYHKPRGVKARPMLSKHWDCRPVATPQYLYHTPRGVKARPIT